jgi:hypothetical protein
MPKNTPKPLQLKYQPLRHLTTVNMMTSATHTHSRMSTTIPLNCPITNHRWMHTTRLNHLPATVPLPTLPHGPRRGPTATAHLTQPLVPVPHLGLTRNQTKTEVGTVMANPVYLGILHNDDHLLGQTKGDTTSPTIQPSLRAHLPGQTNTPAPPQFYLSPTYVPHLGQTNTATHGNHTLQSPPYSVCDHHHGPSCSTTHFKIARTRDADSRKSFAQLLLNRYMTSLSSTLPHYYTSTSHTYIPYHSFTHTDPCTLLYLSHHIPTIILTLFQLYTPPHSLGFPFHFTSLDA